MKYTWFIGIMALVIVGVGVMIFTKKPSSPLPGNSVLETEFEFTENDNFKGPEDALLTLVEFSDFRCPACKTFSTVMVDVLNLFPEDLRIAYKHFPLNLSYPDADIAARASVAASFQNKFWEMHDELYLNQNSWSGVRNPTDLFKEYAEKIGLDVEKFEEDMKSEEVKKIVRADVDLANSLGINSTPTLYLNGKRLTLTSVSGFIQTLEEELAILKTRDDN